MKKASIILFFISLLMLLSGCFENNEFLISKTKKYDYCYRIEDASTDCKRDGSILSKDGETTPVYKNIIEELMALTPDKLTDSYKKNLTDRLDLYGYEYHWNDDLSITVIADGEEMTFGKTDSWPASPDFVKRLPVPSGVAVKETEVKNGSVSITVSMSLDEVKEYAEQLKSAGFTYDAAETTAAGYTYFGKDSDGYSASVTYSSIIQIIKIDDRDENSGPDDDDPGYSSSDKLPTKGLIEKIPSITFGKVGQVYDSSESLSIVLTDVTEAQGKDYIEKCKRSFGTVISDRSAGGTLTFSAYDENDIVLSIVFSANCLTVSVMK